MGNRGTRGEMLWLVVGILGEIAPLPLVCESLMSGRNQVYIEIGKRLLQMWSRAAPMDNSARGRLPTALLTQ